MKVFKYKVYGEDSYDSFFWKWKYEWVELNRVM